ncbi:MAG: globin [Gammaproteobacteria bacterium]|nr:globin [Gammaproteobacteria bacterium]MDH5801187.1 globin [Gammaproteobacteria bacterium]
MGHDELFDQSYERVKGIRQHGKGFFDIFYDKFITASDIVAEHFRNTDMQRQREMLEKSFYSLFIFYATSNANDYLDKIAKQHGKHALNIPDELYDIWIDCLLETVKELDPEYTPEIELSWRLVLSAGIVYMKYKYR